MKPVLVWDIPVRLFHVLLAVGFVTAYSIARFWGEHHPAFVLHMIVGLTLATLVLARVVWGFVGTRWARWSTIVHGPAAFADNVGHLFRKGGRHFTGHNPLSSLGIAAMLGLTLALAVTGYAIGQGNEALEDVHPVLANLFLIVVVGHIAGVILHQIVHGGRLVLGMVDGKKVAPEEDAIRSAAPLGGVLFAALAVWVGGGMWSNLDPANRTTRVPGVPVTIPLGEREYERSETPRLGASSIDGGKDGSRGGEDAARREAHERERDEHGRHREHDD
ncbi:MAG: cytochrome b/b6 domain-containing protein [Fimbriimonadaceae bacterium]